MAIEQDVQRSLGRIEGKLDQTLAELTRLRDDFGEHKDQDQVAFSAVRNLVFTSRDEIKQQFADNVSSRDAHLNSQDIKLDALTIRDKNMKAVGKYILAVIGSFAFLLGSAVVAYITGHITFKH